MSSWLRGLWEECVMLVVLVLTQMSSLEWVGGDGLKLACAGPGQGVWVRTDSAEAILDGGDDGLRNVLEFLLVPQGDRGERLCESTAGRLGGGNVVGSARGVGVGVDVGMEEMGRRRRRR
jgi:hypothetical protein